MNILKVFEDFRQLPTGDQAKIVEWYNLQRGGDPSRVWGRSNAPKVSALKPDGYAPRKFTEEQINFIDFFLHDGMKGVEIAKSCMANWPNERSYDAWLTTVNKRKRDMKEKVQA